MKLNRKLVLILALVLSLAMATTGTLAFLTDRDTEVNVFTMGNVDIELKEDFEQDSALIPGVDIEKEPTITNMGPNDAWVWATIAIPAALDNDDASKNVIHFNMSADSVADGKWTWWEEGTRDQWLKEYDVEYEGVNYNVFTVLYQTALKKGDTTEPVIYKVYMDDHVDIAPDGQLHHVEKGVVTELDWNINTDGNPKIYVSAYAMQTNEFENVYDAYEAYTNQWTATGDAKDAVEWGEDDGETDSGIPEIPADADTWDGTSDTSWYNDSDSEFVITTAEQLAGLAELVDGGNAFDGKTVKLGKNIDLNNYNFSPIGDAKEGKAFKGIFDGQNYAVGNVFYEETASSSGNLYNSLFSYTDGATIKNLKMDDILIARFGGELAAVAGLAKDTTFENIDLTNSRIAGYNNSIGGIVSEVEGTCTFKDVNVDASTSVGTFWGSYDTRVGGIVGYALDGSKIIMEDCTVACQIDAVNDACSNYMWYNYRRAGMLIGEVKGTEDINGTTYASTNGSLTCTNVKVIYGDWANYHYCEFEKNGQGSYNAADEYKYSRVEGTEYNGGHEVTQCNHTAVEDHHNELLVFDQLYGGGQGVKGQPVHDGVTAVYNNK